MSTVTASTQKHPDAPEVQRRTSQPSLYSRYVGAMLYFMGAALIAGAVVHYPIDPPVYAVICIVGAFVFLLGTLVNEFVLAAERPALRNALPLVTFSLLLSFGVGMVGGGIQHFEAFPERSAAMTPIGLLMSYVAFVAKDAGGRWRNLFSRFSAGVVVVSGLTWFGMSALADSMASAEQGTPGTTSNSPAGNAPTPETPGQGGVAEPGNPASHGH